MTRRCLGLVLTLVSLTACADRKPATPFAGTWTLTLNGHPFMVLTVRDESGSYSGELVRPDHFSTSDFVSFSQFGAAVVTERISRGEVRDGRLHFTTVDSRHANDTSDYEMWRDSEQGARIKVSDAPDGFEMPFTRASGAAPAVFTGWEPGCQYRTGELRASSVEMQKVYDADQAPRQDPGRLSAQDWAEIGRKDVERRSQTRDLLARGALHTAEDYTRAAFIFQHGSMPDDFLMAHTLASVAVAKGDASATWIMTATLDRYLQSIGKAQIYGTQFKSVPDGATQEPYDRALVSDALRRELGVPAIAAQLTQQQEFAKQFHADQR